MNEMNERQFNSLIEFFQQHGLNASNSIREAVLIYAVSHGLRSAVGFEAALNECFNDEVCSSGLVNFLQEERLNLACDIETKFILNENNKDIELIMDLIWNTGLDHSDIEPQQNESEVHWLGRIFGYWVPLTTEEYNDLPNRTYNDLSLYVKIDDKWYFLLDFSSLEQITFDMDRLMLYRRAFLPLHIPKNGFKLNIKRRYPNDIDADVTAAEMYF